MENEEFRYLVSDILNNNMFKNLVNLERHGTDTYNHSIRVAELTYKLYNGKYTYDVIRGALLHDFYNKNDINDYNKIETLIIHPNIASINAKKYFNINNRQENIIKSHMFPLGTSIPKSYGAILVSICDKIIAIKEFKDYKFKSKVLKH